MNTRSRWSLVLVCFLLGVGLVAQLRARRGQHPLPSAPSADQSALLGSLVVANGDLRNEVQKLQGEILTYQRAQERTVPQMMEDLERMRKISGHVGVVGGGVEIRVGAAVTALDLQDLLNEIRNVGAEAISLNSHRLTASSSLAEDSRGKTVDGSVIQPPFVFHAIGDPTTMATALNRAGGELSILRATYPGLEVSVKTASRLVLPALRERKQFVLAQPVEQPAP